MSYIYFKYIKYQNYSNRCFMTHFYILHYIYLIAFDC